MSVGAVRTVGGRIPPRLRSLSVEIKLRPVTEADLELFRRYFVEPGLIGPNWMGFRDVGGLRRRFDTDGFLGETDSRLIVDVDGAAAGYVIWFRAGYGPGAYWGIGITLLPEWRGQGIGTRAQQLLVEYLFTHTPTQRLEATTQPENVAEQRALERVGFVREGTMRQAEWRDGAYRDIVLFGRTRPVPHERSG
jgi:[ribosomal protein S5]-alanine N-acetyltransferase